MSQDNSNSTSEDEITETLKLLEEGKAKIVLSEKYRNVTLVLGITGAGKTTFVQWLAGDNSKLISVKDPGSKNDYIIEDGNRIGNSTIESKTKFPELVVDAKTDTAYYDCPGFIDSRGIGNDIASTYFIKIVADHAQFVKLVFVIDYPSVRKTGNRDTFTNLLKHSTEVIASVDKFRTSIALVASKVDNQIVELEDGKFERVSDEDMIEPIVYFLREVKQDLTKQSAKGDSDLIKFIDVVLQADGSKYPKIGLFRRPNKPGPLSEIPLLQEGKAKIAQMVEKLQFTPVDEKDFGYTISDKSKNNINGLVKIINDRVWTEVEAIVSVVKTSFQQQFDEKRRKIDSFVTSEYVPAYSGEAQFFNFKLEDSTQAVSDVVKDVANMTTLTGLAEKLNNTLSVMEISTCEANVERIANEATYFKFLQSVSDTTLATRNFETLLQTIVDSLSSSRQILQIDIGVVLDKIVSSINTTANSVAEKFWSVKLGQIKTMEIDLLPRILNEESFIMQQMTLLLNRLNKAQQLVESIEKYSRLLGDDAPQIMSLAASITNQAKYLNYLSGLSDQKIKLWSDDWTLPFTKTTKLYRQLADWYNFLADLYAKIGEYNFQKDLTQFDWTNVPITNENIKDFFKKLGPYNILLVDALKDTQIADWQLQELNQLLKHKLVHECRENEQLVVTGDYVKFSDFTKSNKISADLCPNKKISSVNVYAANTVFIDTDLDGVGEKLKLTVAAPKWKIIDTRKINLDGAAQTQTFSGKADDGKYTGNAGSAGQPGLPGGSAGSFMGVGKMFFNGKGLTITANGGAASAGQDGGDGHLGADGKDAENPTGRCEISGAYTTVQSSTSQSDGCFNNVYDYLITGTKAVAGGNGGDGGAGGIGGKNGEIKLFNLKTNAEIVTQANGGSDGKNGTAGSGKDGGKDGNQIRARCTTQVCPPQTINQLDDKSDVPIDTRAGPGKNGSDGANREGLTEPDAPATIQDSANIINEFKSYLRQNLNDNNTERFKRNLIVQFLGQLDGDQQVKDTYDTLAFANELEGLERQFRELTNRQDVTNYYKSLLDRIGAYVQSPKPNEKSKEYRKMFNYIYAAVFGKLYNFKAGAETNLIVDVEGYLDMAKDNIDILNKLRKEQNEHQIVDQYKDKYLDNIQQHIKEANQFIEKQITPEFDKIDKQIDEQIELLIKAIEEMQKKAEEQKKELIKKREQLQNQMILRGIFSIIKVVSQVATFLGPQGMMIGTTVSAADSLAESFVLDDKTGEQKAFTLSSDMQKNIKSLEDGLKVFNERNLKDLKDKIDNIKKELQPDPEFDDLTKKLDSIVERLDKKDPPIAEDPNRIDVLDEADQEMKKELKAKETELKAKKDRGEVVKERSITVMATVNKISTASSVALDIYSKVRGDQARLDATDAALAQVEQQLIQLDQYKMTIYRTISPGMQKLSNDLKMIQRKLDGKSHEALDVTQWQVQGMLKDIKLQMQKVTKGQTVEDDLARCIEKLDEAMTIMIKLYDRIQSYQEQQELANFLGNINSHESNNLNITDPKLSAALNKLDIVIRSNVVLQQYDATVVALKQLVFPYAQFYLETFTLPSSHSQDNSTDIDDLVTSASASLEKMKNKVTINRTSISKFDKYAHSAVFDAKATCASPFYVWRNAAHRDTISQLLSGNVVVLKANIKQSAPDKDSIKFNLVELNFKTNNASKQTEIDEKLKKFILSATHLGNSYYRYDGQFYVINNEPQNIQYSFAKDSTGLPIDRNNVYTKIKTGDMMLSPYAMWQIQLLKMNESLSFDQLSLYKDEIDLELVGQGSYTVSKGVNIELQVKDNYKEYVEMDQIENDAAELNAIQMSYIAYREALNNCTNSNFVSLKSTKRNELFRSVANVPVRLPLFGLSNSTQNETIDSAKSNQSLFEISNATRAKRSTDIEVQTTNYATGALSFVRQFAKTVSNYFASAESNIEHTHKFSNDSKANLTQVNSIDVHSNLVMSQLIVGLIAGKNKSLTNESVYLSPEQARTVQVETLANKILPNLHNLPNPSENDNNNNQNNRWSRDLMFTQNETTRNHN